MRRGAAVAAIVAILTVLSACASPRNALNTPDSACFRGVPAAGAAVGPKGRVIGVRAVRRETLVRRLPEAARIPDRVVCAVAYRGDFVPGDVRDADPAGPGPYALVALDVRTQRVLATFVVDRLPVGFKDRF